MQNNNKQSILANINHPNDLKKLNNNELKDLTNEIRQLILDTSKTTDLHYSSNLGIVELSMLILKVFNIDNDYILYDTGHQTYTHKILTDRKNKFPLIKKDNGISGLMNMHESIYDHYSPGHSGNILSIASGIYQSLDNPKHKNLYKNEKNIIAVVGDSAFANGLNFEALNDISFAKEPIIIILNDNDMSISKPVGAMSKVFNKLKSKKTFHFIERATRHGIKSEKIYSKVFNLFYRFQWKLIGRNLIEQLGFNYIGVIDGHNIKELEMGLKRAKWFARQGPVVVHVKTIKGKGDKEAENDNIGNYHSLLNKQEKTFGMYATEFLLKLMQKHQDIRVINPAMSCASNSFLIKEKYPNRFFDVGIAEEHALSKGSGMSLANLTPYIFIYSTFLQRAYDQLLHDYARLNLKCNLLIDRADLAPAEGGSHHGIYDVGYLKTIPNTIIASPRNISQLKQLIDLSYSHNKNQIFAIRYTKNEVMKVDINQDYKVQWGNWEQMINHKQPTVIISYGSYINKIYDMLQQHQYPVDLVNAIFIHGYNKQQLSKIFKQYKNIIIYERIYANHGLASDLLAYKAANNLTNHVEILNYPDGIEWGEMKNLEKQHKMDLNAIEKTIKKLI